MKDAIASGIDGYDDDVKKSVRKAARGLRLTREAAMSIASMAVSIQSDCFLCLSPFPPVFVLLWEIVVCLLILFFGEEGMREGAEFGGETEKREGDGGDGVPWHN